MMKRSVVLVLTGLIFTGAGSLTQGADEARKETTTSYLKGKTAYVNLSAIVKNYSKFQRFSTTAKGQVEKIETKIKKLKVQLEAQTKELAQPGIPTQDRLNGEKNARALQREMEDLAVEGRALVGQSSDHMMVEIYRDIRVVVAEYARREGIDAVLHYNDATPGTPEFFSPQNISRKLQSGAAMPFYIAPGLEITEAIQNELNTRARDSDE